MQVKFATSLLCGLLGAASNASLVVFSGADVANSTDPRPNSIAAALAFDTAAAGLGSVNVIDFESAAVGTFSNLALGGGVSLAGIDFISADQEIRNTPISPPDGLFGFNTTTGGTNFASMNGGTLTFTFATPVQSFGAYFSGVQISAETITFNDGTSQTMNLVNLGSGVQFLGFTDAGQSISSITIGTFGDIIGVDDVRYVNTSTVPEPASLAVLTLGALALIRRRK